MATLRRIGRLRIPIAVAASVLGLATPAAAQPAAGIVAAPGNLLVTFDSGAPGTFTSARPIAGLQAGEQLAALAVSGGGTLFGVGVVQSGTDSVRLYRIDAGTGVATSIGGATGGLTTSTAYGADFDDDAGRVRVVSGASEHFLLDPAGGRAEPEDDLRQSQIAAIATGGTGALLGLRHATSELVAINPIGGAVSAIGSLEVVSGSAEALNLDVAADGTTFATALPAGGLPGLYAANTATGALTLAGTLPAALRAFALLPATTVRFGATTHAGAETGVATIAVTRSGPATATATVHYATADGSATTADYVPAAGMLTFAPGETTKTFAVALRDDGAAEGDETVELALSSPAAPLALGSPATATLTIVDDEVVSPPPNLRLKRLPHTMKLGTLLRRGVRVTATPNKPVRLTFVLLGRTRIAQLSASENLALVTRSPRGLVSGRRSIVLKPRRALVGRPRADFRVRVQAIATDAEGRVRTVNRVIRIRVPARSR